MKKLWYVASPYSHPDESVRIARYRAAVHATMVLFQKNIATFGPIAFSANSSFLKYNIKTDFAAWEALDKLFISKSDGIIVLTIDGWDRSVGVTAEIAFAKSLGLPVLYKTVDELEHGDISDILELENGKVTTLHCGEAKL